MRSKVTAPSVQSFLGSLGIGLGEELQMVDKEANEVAAYRRVQAGKKQSSHKEKELQSLEIDLTAGNATLQAARKCAAEALHKKLAKTLMDTREENARALEDLHVAIDTTRKKYELHEQRESSRRKIAQNVTGEQSAREMKRLRQESQTQAIQFTQIQNELMTTDAKLLTLEADLRRLSEAAGTNDIDKIIAKYLSREETLRNLKEEHAITDAKMRKLRDNYKQLQEQLATLRGATMNTRGIYQEMDDTAEKLKDIEKNASALQERCNRANVLGNIRVRPKSQPKGSKVAKILRHNSQRDSLSISPTKDKVSRDEDDAMAPAMASSTVAAEDDPIIDRTMRKKLVGLVLNRGKRVKKGTTNNEKV
ncbi:hypothetical protein DYB32_004693 [Aphanomyces invadans]|uniref:Uncharacterized protein n=1 Tax=Aphanomyces invadans TaxID=157072 RepID=A0A418AWW7_9STRA|nr:hypothetical protein DYB32_004693 [Aphanomyces invadans]